MKLRAILATIIGAASINGAAAGESWCAPVLDKCPIEECCGSNGSISIGYETDYIFYGVRLGRDNIWADVNYTFDSLPLPLTVGVWHMTTLGSGVTSRSFDQTNIYGSVELPSFAGFDISMGFTQYIFPTDRAAQNATGGDSSSELNLVVSRELGCGVSAFYRAAYDFNMPGALANPFQPVPQDNDTGAWVHTAGIDAELPVTDCISATLSAGVRYTDNYWSQNIGATRTSGWNNYYVQAGLPVAISSCATLTPYIGYSGTPDTWVADGITGMGVAGNGGANGNDVLHGGVSLSVSF